MTIKLYRKIVIEADTARENLVQEKLPYEKNELEVMSSDTLDYHYGKLASAYVKRYNDEDGDDDFNYGGAKLHNLFFPQLQPVSVGNKPTGISQELIDSNFGSFESFKEEFSKVAMGIQGSGWLYLDTKGRIKTIKNHGYKRGMKIALLVDWWEHAWALDYQADKSKYLANIWKIINWLLILIQMTLKGITI